MTDPEIDWDGNKYWYNENGQLHRTTGPAVEYADGDKHWYLNGHRHRTDGPAVEYTNGRKYWYIRGTELTEEDHQLLTFVCYNTV